MPGWFTPRRRRGVELLDDPAVDPALRARAMKDLARSNRYFGGTRAVVRAVERLPALPGRTTILDVGTGTGDIASALERRARARGATVSVIGIDLTPSLLTNARARPVVAGDAMCLPFRDASVDVVVCSQLLHHFAGTDAERLVGELGRVSREWIVVADLRRSLLAAAGFWIAATALRFHPITRADGVTSVMRGFTSVELRRLVRQVTGVDPAVTGGLFWRLVATWRRRSGR